MHRLSNFHDIFVKVIWIILPYTKLTLQIS